MKNFFVLLPLLAATAFAQTNTGDAVNGKRLVMRNGCYQCHGTVGQGGLPDRASRRRRWRKPGSSRMCATLAPATCPHTEAK